MFIQTFKMAIGAVFANKMRTFLTMLGIIIGVAALIILVSIANGATSSVSERISSIGSNYLVVQITDDKENPLRLSEFDELMKNDAIDASAPVSRTNVTAKSGYTSGTMTLYGTNGAYFDIMNSELSSGRTLKKTDLDNSSYVIMITEDTAVELFGHTNVVGENVSLDGRSFQIIGVLSEDETSENISSGIRDSSDDEEESVELMGYIPYSTLPGIGENALDITQFYVSASDKTTMDYAEETLEKIMLKRFDNDEDAFQIVNQSQVLEAMNEVKNTLSYMLGGIAAISLLVGGIGIMNIMLVSVTERTREIGIRKAIGAGKGSIMGQFLLEAVIVSMAGCFIGIVFSWIALQIIGKIMDNFMSLSMNGTVVLVSVIFSMVIGIVFGLYPANKAAKKKPIDALRYTG